jgi:hypothetical protein
MKDHLKRDYINSFLPLLQNFIYIDLKRFKWIHLLHNEFTNSIFKRKMAKVATTSIFFLFWLLLPEESPAFSGKYPIKNFAPADYGAGIQNIDFAQNRDLSLFVANNLGVLSFNGSAWGKHAH